MLLRKCMNTEPPQSEFELSDKYLKCIKPYKPPNAPPENDTFVDLSNSIALVNKYCAKLPSDTFTKLTPLWRCCRLIRNEKVLYQYTIRLPINSPLKYDITGPPMPNRVLARKVCALAACKTLHESGELDNNLQPIGKEGFRAFESDWENFELEQEDEAIVNENTEPRPGTTKRRQYYYKRVSSLPVQILSHFWFKFRSIFRFKFHFDYLQPLTLIKSNENTKFSINTPKKGRKLKKTIELSENW